MRAPESPCRAAFIYPHLLPLPPASLCLCSPAFLRLSLGPSRIRRLRLLDTCPSLLPCSPPTMASVVRTLTRAAASQPLGSSARRTFTSATRSHPTSFFQSTKQSARRSFASEAGAPKSKTGLYVGLSLLAAGGVGGYFYINGQLNNLPGARDVKSATFTPTKDDYQKVYNDVAELLEAGDYDDGSFGPVCCSLNLDPALSLRGGSRAI